MAWLQGLRAQMRHSMQDVSVHTAKTLLNSSLTARTTARERCSRCCCERLWVPWMAISRAQSGGCQESRLCLAVHLPALQGGRTEVWPQVVVVLPGGGREQADVHCAAGQLASGGTAPRAAGGAPCVGSAAGRALTASAYRLLQH